MLLSKRVVRINQCFLHVVVKIGLKLLNFSLNYAAWFQSFKQEQKTTREVRDKTKKKYIQVDYFLIYPT
jgi:hypothetical protein